MVQRKERQERLVKGNDGLQKGGFRPYQPGKSADKDYTQNKGRGKGPIRNRQRKNLSSIQIVSLRNNEEGHGRAWESDDRSSNHWTDDSWTPDAG